MTDVPVNEGDYHDVNIIALGRKGDGIARVQGFVVLVRNALVNHSYRIRITKVCEKFAFGEIICLYAKR